MWQTSTTKSGVSQMPKNLLDMMRPEDKERMIRRFKARTASNPTKSNKISNEMYLLAEFGLMFGWEAIRDARNDVITFEEMFALIEAGKKVQARELLEHGTTTTASVMSAFSKSNGGRVQRGMNEILERANK